MSGLVEGGGVGVLGLGAAGTGTGTFVFGDVCLSGRIPVGGVEGLGGCSGTGTGTFKLGWLESRAAVGDFGGGAGAVSWVNDIPLFGTTKRHVNTCQYLSLNEKSFVSDC